MSKFNQFFANTFLLCVLCLTGTSAMALSTSVNTNNQSATISIMTTDRTCAIRNDGEVACWGFRQDPVQPEKPFLRGVSNAVQIIDYCAVNKFGNVYCWSAANNLPAQQVQGVTNAVSVVRTARESYCAVHSNGNVSCWGYNLRGEMGDGTIETNLTNPTWRNPTLVPNVNNVVSLAVTTVNEYSNNHLVCGVRVDGSVVCWGQFIQLNTPTLIANATDVRQAEITENGVCLLRSDNKVSCLRQGQNFNNFANYYLVDNLSYVNGLSANVYTGLCANVTQNDPDMRAKCFSLFNTAVTSAASGYLTTLTGSPSGAIQQLRMGVNHSCAVNADNSMQCMFTGLDIPLKSCDLSASGSACLSTNIQAYNVGQFGLPSTTSITHGVWYAVPNFSVLPSAQPIMFESPSNISLDSRTISSLTLSFNRDVSSTAFDVYYRVKGSNNWTKSTATVNTTNARALVTLTGLKSNTQYEIKIRGKNWASITNDSVVFTAATVNPLTCEITRNETFSGGAVYEAKITNTGNTSTTGWNIKFNFYGAPARVVNQWNMANASISGNAVLGSNVTRNYNNGVIAGNNGVLSGIGFQTQQSSGVRIISCEATPK